jgi:hypothetical protein
MTRQTALWALVALLGIVLAAGITWATSQLTSQHIGLSSEPLSAGRRLAPADSATRTTTSRSTRATPAVKVRTVTVYRTPAPARAPAPARTASPQASPAPSSTPAESAAPATTSAPARERRSTPRSTRSGSDDGGGEGRTGEGGGASERREAGGSGRRDD